MLQSIEFPGKFPLLLNGILGLLLLWVVASWFVGDESEVGFQMEEMQQVRLPDLTEIQADIFGKKSTVPIAKPVVREVVASPLNIKLLGTVVAGDNSAAVIADTGGRNQRAVFIGGNIQAGVTLHEVKAASIIIERAGAFEEVKMEKPRKLSGSPLNATLRPAPVAAPLSSPQLVGRPMNGLPAAASGEFMQLLSQARVTPHFSDGRPDGFMIGNIVPGSMYEQLGLRNGDLIRSVNGQKITNAQQAMSMYQMLQRGGSVDVELIRAGQVQQLHYDFAAK